MNGDNHQSAERSSNRNRANSALDMSSSPPRDVNTSWMKGMMTSVPSLGPEEMETPKQKTAFEYKSTESYKKSKIDDFDPSNRMLLTEVERLRMKVEKLEDNLKRKDQLIDQKEKEIEKLKQLKVIDKYQKQVADL